MSGYDVRTLYLCRHGESEANVANARALAAGAEDIGAVDEDALVRLTPHGIAQARELGAYFARCDDPPSLIISSPYARCCSTAEIAAEASGIAGTRVTTDARLHERSLGILDRLTPTGIRMRFPEEAAKRAEAGKFAYRPPKGESWEGVANRVRPFCDALRPDEGGISIAVVTHQAVLLCMRYVLESLSVEQLAAVDRAAEVGNAAVTQYRAGADGRFALAAYNVPAHAAETPHA